MFKNLFKREIKRAAVERVEIPRVEVDRARVELLEQNMSKAYQAMTIRFQDTTTGEITEVVYGDHDNFNKYMGNKNMRLIFS